MAENYTGNISTIVKWISMIIAGNVIGALAAQGLHLNVDATTLSEVIGAFIFLVIGYIDAKYPNTFKFLDNAEPPVVPEPEILNQEYVTGDIEDDI